MNILVRDAYTRDICSGDIYIRANTCSDGTYIGVANMKSAELAFIKSTSIKISYIRIAYYINISRLHLWNTFR